MEVRAKITGLNYKPFLCRDLNEYNLDDLSFAISKEGAFILNFNKHNKFGISWWVSAKRTRSYPYARVYDTLSFTGKRVTIIPVFKDEGKRGDRDYIQWDTISLMSLLGVYVIIAYYSSAERNPRYNNKITNQRFDLDYINEKLNCLSNYQSDALHWNLQQVDNISEIAQRALDSYSCIADELGVEMHSESHALKRIEQLSESKESFMNLSCELAQMAQKRESVTLQPKEMVNGNKGIITIKNYLGGLYYLTSDEIEIVGDTIYLIEAKHTKSNYLPSIDDIKDGLIKMTLFTNLKNVKMDKKNYQHKSVLKLTSAMGFDYESLNDRMKDFYNLLVREANQNNFSLRIS